jgi:hypothetical protein
VASTAHTAQGAVHRVEDLTIRILDPGTSPVAKLGLPTQEKGRKWVGEMLIGKTSLALDYSLGACASLNSF